MGICEMIEVASKIDMENGIKDNELSASVLLLLSSCPPDYVRERHNAIDYETEQKLKANKAMVQSDIERLEKEKAILKQGEHDKYKAYISFLQLYPTNEVILKYYGTDISNDLKNLFETTYDKAEKISVAKALVNLGHNEYKMFVPCPLEASLEI